MATRKLTGTPAAIRRALAEIQFNPDVEFNGEGVWFALADTDAGEEFLTDYVCFAPWQGNPHDGIAIDGGSMAQEIADAAIDCGLLVSVNGAQYRP